MRNHRPVEPLVLLALLAAVVLLLVGCAGPAAAPQVGAVTLAPVVATLVPTNTPKPPTATPLPPTDTPVPPTPTTVPTAAPPANSILAGENPQVAVYLVSPSNDIPPKGQLVLIDKGSQKSYEIGGTFEVFGRAIVFNDQAMQYVALSLGTSTYRSLLVLSLAHLAQVGSPQPVSCHILFWKDYLIFDKQTPNMNRPWEAGQAWGVSVMNLSTGEVTDLYKPDLLNQYTPSAVNGDTLAILHESVAKQADWGDQKSVKSESLIYDLTRLR